MYVSIFWTLSLDFPFFDFSPILDTIKHVKSSIAISVHISASLKLHLSEHNDLDFVLDLTKIF